VCVHHAAAYYTGSDPHPHAHGQIIDQQNTFNCHERHGGSEEDAAWRSGLHVTDRSHGAWGVNVYPSNAETGG